MILITGDSWACGEWTKDSHHRHTISHSGLAQYLREYGHQVVNLGKGGGSNLESASRVSDFLAEENGFADHIDCVVVFQTEWIRDTLNLWNFDEFEKVDYNYTQLKDRLISRFYYRLSEAATYYNVPIYVVGGCGDALWLDRFEQEYPGVTIACQSWVNLMLNKNHRVNEPVFARFGGEIEKLLQYVKHKINHNSVESLLHDMSLAEQRSQQWQQLFDQGFLCDDYTHPNRLAHKILFDHLILCVPQLEIKVE